MAYRQCGACGWTGFVGPWHTGVCENCGGWLARRFGWSGVRSEPRDVFEVCTDGMIRGVYEADD